MQIAGEAGVADDGVLGGGVASGFGFVALASPLLRFDDEADHLRRRVLLKRAFADVERRDRRFGIIGFEAVRAFRLFSEFKRDLDGLHGKFPL